MRAKLIVGHDGRLWCMGGARYHVRGVKQHYATIDDAWRDAFIRGALYGEVMTPYRCIAGRKMVAEVDNRPHPNPWSFKPWLNKVILREYRRRQCCGGYHLTRKGVDFMLPRHKGREGQVAAAKDVRLNFRPGVGSALGVMDER